VQQKPKPPQDGIELNFVASFPRPAWSIDKEKKLALASTWFPSTVDFQAVAGRGSIVVGDVWTFVLEIAKSKKPIKRLNFFSHGNSKVITCAGAVLLDGTDVSLSVGDRTTWGQIFGDTRAIAMPYSQDMQGHTNWGDHGELSANKINVNNADVTLDEVRAKFAEDAVIWLYICHAAGDPLLAQQISNAFQATIKGFNNAIVFCPPDDFPSNRKHKVTIQTTTVQTACDQEKGKSRALDFHWLDKDQHVRTFAPKKPTTITPGP
jgi:hypothetical protein